MALNDYENFGTIDEQIARAILFCDAYNLKKDEREGLADIIIKRLKALIDFIIKSAEEGEIKYIEAIDNCHHIKYINDIEYIKFHTHIIDKYLKEK